MNQNIKIGIGVLAVFGLGFAIARATAKKDTSDKESSEQKEIESESRTLSKVQAPAQVVEEEKNDSFPLQLGSKGDKVLRLQIHLMRNLGWVRKPDGIFDLITQERALKQLKVEQVSEKLYNELELDKMIHDQRKKRA